jgi:hypothetical protein
MKFCEKHWQMLRDEAEKQGLGDYVAKSGEEAYDRAMKAAALNEADKPADVANFEPVIGAHNAIIGKVVSYVGMGVLEVAGEGDDEVHHCPLCYITKVHEEQCTDERCEVKNFDYWIEGAMGDQKKELERFQS